MAGATLYYSNQGQSLGSIRWRGVDYKNEATDFSYRLGRLFDRDVNR